MQKAYRECRYIFDSLAKTKHKLRLVISKESANNILKDERLHEKTVSITANSGNGSTP